MGVEYIILAIIGVILIISFVMLFDKRKTSHDVDENTSRMANNNDLRSESYKLIIPLKIQACERLMLYVERIKFPVLVKRVYQTGISRDDFQFVMLQNVQDEFEHNLAQRLYVSEATWQLIELSKEEVMQNINAVFNDNPESNVSMIAAKLASFENPMVENAVKSIKKEFNSF